MIIKELREYINEAYDEVCLFDNPSFDKSLIGITDEGEAIYGYNAMVEELAEDDNITSLEAMEFIDYNTMRSLPYTHPRIIVVNEITNEDY